MKHNLRFFGRLGIDEDEETQQKAERDAEGEPNDPQYGAQKPHELQNHNNASNQEEKKEMGRGKPALRYQRASKREIEREENSFTRREPPKQRLGVLTTVS